MESSNNIHLDEKWKLSKKGSKNYSKSKREQSSNNCNASNVDVPPSYLKRSSSMPDSVKASRVRPNSNQSSRSFSRKCANLAKEQRAKFYIVRRCVTMLMCWRDYP